jgi:hypothetical protein
MFDSPLIREIVGDRFHKVILKLLATRFGPVSPEFGSRGKVDPR